MASANPVKSRYTAIELKACTPVGSPAAARAWTCPGLANYPVYLAETASRLSLAFGREAQRHRAATQTLRPPNTIFEDGKRRPTIEWRFVRREGRDVPYAAIVGYRTAPNGARGRVLVVTKVGDGESCHVAYIDGQANPDAIVLARNIADREARTFSCTEEPRRVGASGQHPM